MSTVADPRDVILAPVVSEKAYGLLEQGVAGDVGEAGNGLVKVTMLGSGEVTDVQIDPKVVDPEDVDGLQDLILGAFGDATKKVQDLAQEKMGPLQEGFGGLGGDFGF